MNVTRYKDSLSGDWIYKTGQYKIDKYNDEYMQLIYFKKLKRIAGYELPSDKNKSKKGFVNDKKLFNNVRRSVNKVFEFAMCNDWEYFCTFTIDGTKYPRNDLKTFYKIFANWLRNINYNRRLDIKYLFVPELHSDNINWHFHGLIKGLPDYYLSDFQIGKHPNKLIEKGYKNWEEYENKFGFCSFDKIRNKEKVSNYITKYIIKSINNSAIGLNQKLYYNSQGLKQKEKIIEGNLFDDFLQLPKFDYENEYVAVKKIKINK